MNPAHREFEVVQMVVEREFRYNACTGRGARRAGGRLRTNSTLG